MNKLPYTYQLKSRDDKGRYVHQRVITKDKYDKWWLRPERTVVRGGMTLMHLYLMSFPDMAHESKWNMARHITHRIPTVKPWLDYMPTGFATHHMHNPEIRRYANDKKVGSILRMLFRHTLDPVGMRTRAYVLSRWVLEFVKTRGDKPLRWVSIAAGSGQPVFDILTQLSAKQVAKTDLTLIDINPDMLAFAEKVYASYYDLQPRSLEVTRCDVTKRREIAELLQVKKPHIIDVMGLFEYLDERTAATLLDNLYDNLQRGGVLIFTNMNATRPQVEYHRKGAGWKGVIPRTRDEVCDIIEASRAGKGRVTVATPQDNVYNIYRIEKP